MICVRCSKDLRPPGIHTCCPADKQHLLHVDAPHFHAGAIFFNDTCIEAAPILRWCEGKSYREIAQYAKRKRWSLRVTRIQ